MRPKATIVEQLEIIIQMVEKLEKWSSKQEKLIISQGIYDEKFIHEILSPMLRESGNYTKTSKEILSKYKQFWIKEQKEGVKTDDHYHWKCMSEIINVLRFMLFIPTFSEIEYAMIKTMKNSTHPVGLSVWQKEDRGEAQLVSFFRDIIRPSTDHRIFNRREERVWRGIIWTRNNLIHNKGIATKKYRFRIYDLEIAFDTDAKIWARIDAFILLAKWVQEHFMMWFAKIYEESKGEVRNKLEEASV
ncbi:MAG: hypothetical protein ACTSYA_05825 [Candidatus Kariarchaeaceae archaeon]